MIKKGAQSEHNITVYIWYINNAVPLSLLASAVQFVIIVYDNQSFQRYQTCYYT